MSGMDLGEIVAKAKDRQGGVQEYPPCPNKDCECYGSSARIARSHVGKDYYCYECCQTF